MYFLLVFYFKKRPVDRDSLDNGIVKASYSSAHVESSLNWNFKNKRYTFPILVFALEIKKAGTLNAWF